MEFQFTDQLNSIYRPVKFTISTIEYYESIHYLYLVYEQMHRNAPKGLSWSNRLLVELNNFEIFYRLGCGYSSFVEKGCSHM